MKYQRYTSINIELVTIVTLFFLCWVINEILQRIFAQESKIYTTQSLINYSAQFNEPVANNTLVMMKRMTKSIGKERRFRMQPRGSVMFIKALFIFSGLCALCGLAISEPIWYYDHFILADESTINYSLYRMLVSAVIAMYVFEIFANRYYTLDKSTLVHHWVSIAAALLVSSGYFSRNATWMSIWGICAPPLNPFMFGFKAIYATKSEWYSRLTRKGWKIAMYAYIPTIIINVCGQLIIGINELLVYKHYAKFVIVCISVMALFYDDYHLVQAIRSFSKMEYELSLQLPDLSDLAVVKPSNRRPSTPRTPCAEGEQ